MESLNPFATYDSFDELDELLTQVFPSPPQSPSPASRPALTAGILADFVDARLANLGWSIGELAAHLGQEPAFVEALLSGQVSADQLNDDFIVHLAEVLDYAPNLLRIVLGRAITPTLEAAQTQDTPAQPTAASEPPVDYPREIGLLLDRIHHLTTLMLQEAHQNEAFDAQQLQQYDFVLQQIETIVSKQKSDNKLRLDIRRIIHFIQDAV